MNSAHDQAVVLQAASVCLQYPDDTVLAMLPPGRAARSTQLPARSPARTADRVPRRRRGAPRPTRMAAALRRGVRHAPPLLPLPDLVDRRRDPPPRQRARRAQGALPRRRRRARRPRSCPTSCPRCSSSPPPPTSPAASQLLQEHRAGHRAAAPGAARRRHPLRGARRGGLRAAAGPVARRRRRGEGPGPHRAAHGSRSGSSSPRSRRHRREDADERRSTCSCGGCCPTSWSPCWSAARSGATATTSSAGPPAPRSCTSRGCCASAARCSTSGSSS